MSLRRRGLLASAFAAALALGAPPQALGQDVAHRAALSVDGEALDLGWLLPSGEGPVRVVLSGTVSSRIDGAELDALYRFVGGARDASAGPFVRLPPGSRLVSEDPGAHRYLVEVPRGPDMRVRFDAAPLAARHLVTLSEVRAGLVGAVELEVLAPPPGPTARVLRATTEGAAVLPLAFAGGALALPALGLLGLLVLGRRRRHRERLLVARARGSLAAIEREAARLGPVFLEVVASSRRTMEAALELERHYLEACRAERRTRSLRSVEASRRRAELGAQKDESLTRMRGLVERLEETATRLASHAAAEARPRDVEALLASLVAETELAVRADAEAGS